MFNKLLLLEIQISFKDFIFLQNMLYVNRYNKFRVLQFVYYNNNWHEVIVYISIKMKTMNIADLVFHYDDYT